VLPSISITTTVPETLWIYSKTFYVAYSFVITNNDTELRELELSIETGPLLSARVPNQPLLNIGPIAITVATKQT
jgi:hypothetical protein